MPQIFQISCSVCFKCHVLDQDLDVEIGTWTSGLGYLTGIYSLSPRILFYSGIEYRSLSDIKPFSRPVEFSMTHHNSKYLVVELSKGNGK